MISTDILFLFNNFRHTSLETPLLNQYTFCIFRFLTGHKINFKYNTYTIIFPAILRRKFIYYTLFNHFRHNTCSNSMTSFTKSKSLLFFQRHRNHNDHNLTVSPGITISVPCGSYFAGDIGCVDKTAAYNR